MKKSRSKRAESPSELIDARIEDLGDWRGEMLSRIRALIKEADPEVTEEWKWRESSLVAQRADLHRRGLQEGREDDLRQRSLPEGSFWSVQFQSRRQRQARYRRPRRRQAGREGSEGSHSGRRGLEQVFIPPLGSTFSQSKPDVAGEKQAAPRKPGRGLELVRPPALTLPRAHVAGGGALDTVRTPHARPPGPEST